MSEFKDKIINGIIDVEGGYVNDLLDSGGETNYGVTIATARRYGYLGPMKSMPKQVAFDVYKDMYWNALKLDDVEALSQAVAAELVDTGVNQGVGRAAEFLQRSLNVLNNQGQDWADMKVDGSVGPLTIACLKKFFAKRGKDGEKVLLRMLNCLQGAFYVALAERRQKDERFVYGWFANRVQ